MCEGEGGEKGGEGWYEGSERGVVEESVDGARVGRREGRAGMRAVREEWLKRVLMGRGWGEGRGGEGWYEGSERGVVEESVDGARVGRREGRGGLV